MPMCRRILILALMFLPASAFAGETCLDYDEADRVCREYAFPSEEPPEPHDLDPPQKLQPPQSFGDGIHIIGTDIEPGTYRSAGGDGCYYARLRGFGGTLDEIIANELSDGPSIVEISQRDKGFSSKGCGTWTKID